MGNLAGILRDFFWPTEERLKYFGEKFGAFFVRKFVAQINSWDYNRKIIELLTKSCSAALMVGHQIVGHQNKPLNFRFADFRRSSWTVEVAIFSNHFILIDACLAEFLVVCLRICTGFKRISFRETHLWEHFGRTDKIALITCLKKLNVSDAFLICSRWDTWITTYPYQWLRWALLTFESWKALKTRVGPQLGQGNNQ